MEFKFKFIVEINTILHREVTFVYFLQYFSLSFVRTPWRLTRTLNSFFFFKKIVHSILWGGDWHLKKSFKELCQQRYQLLVKLAT